MTKQPGRSDAGDGLERAKADLGKQKSGPGGFVEDVAFGVWMCDPSGELRYASDAFLHLLAMPMDEAQGFGWTERVPPEDRQSIARWRQCVERGEDWDDEHRIRDYRGHVRTLLARGHAVRGAAGEITCWVGLHLDITERKRLERLVQDARAYAEGIVDTLREPLLVLDSALSVRSSNRAFYRRFGVTPEETEGRFVYDLGNGQWDIPALRALLEDVLPGTSSFDGYEVEHEFPQIGRRVMLLNARRLRQSGEEGELILLSIEDVTDRREAEDRLTMLRVTEAEQQERQRLGVRLHDHMQQLLLGATMHVSIVHGEERDAEKRSLLEKALGILKEANAACRDLAVELSPPVLFTEGLVAALGWLADRMRDRHGLRVDVHADALCGADAELEEERLCVLLFEVVRGLLLNVVKHARVDHATIDAARVEGDVIEITVRDEGVGFDAGAAERAIDPAAGYGLPMIRHRLRSVGGSLDVASGPGRGTTATVRVPIHATGRQ